MELNFDYATCVANSERVSWRLDEVLPQSASLDRRKRFLPNALAPNDSLAFLSDAERRTLNQISGKAYMNLFGFVEVYIEAMVLEHAQAALFGDRGQMRALVRFADEEVKHQQLFTRFCALFDQQFGVQCPVLDRPIEVANTILATSPLAVLLTTLHIEQMTQQHYLESVRDDVELDALCAEILRRHWLEESQHAKIDLLLLCEMHAKVSEEGRETAFAEYLAVLEAFDGLLGQQAALDASSFEAVSARSLSPAERAALVASQHMGYRKTFIVCGLTNPLITEVIRSLWPAKTAQSAERARAMGAT